MHLKVSNSSTLSYTVEFPSWIQYPSLSSVPYCARVPTSQFLWADSLTARVKKNEPKGKKRKNMSAREVLQQWKVRVKISPFSGRWRSRETLRTEDTNELLRE